MPQTSVRSKNSRHWGTHRRDEDSVTAAKESQRRRRRKHHSTPKGFSLLRVVEKWSFWDQVDNTHRWLPITDDHHAASARYRLAIAAPIENDSVPTRMQLINIAVPPYFKMDCSSLTTEIPKPDTTGTSRNARNDPTMLPTMNRRTCFQIRHRIWCSIMISIMHTEKLLRNRVFF